MRLLLLGVHVCALTMHFAVLPLAYVGTTIWPLKLAIAMPFVV